jgi:hypothetical protein
MATFGRLRALRHGQAIHRKFSRCAAIGSVALILFLDGAIAGLAIAQSEAPTALVPDNFSWRKSAGQSGLTGSLGPG